MSPELTNIVLVAAGVLGVVILTIGVVAFIRREVRPKIATPAGLIRPPGDGDLRATRRHHPPTGKPTPKLETGCHWCTRTAVWRDMVKFSCDVHRKNLYRGGSRAHRLRVELGDGSVRVGHDIIHPGKPIRNEAKDGDQAG
jgi:hypothetical protein